DSGQLYVNLGHNMDILPELLEDTTDNHILAIGSTLQKQLGPQRRVIIITTDTNLRIKAAAFGLEAEDFEADKVHISDLYNGVADISVTATMINQFYSKRRIELKDHKLYPNQFVIMKDEKDPNQFVYGRYDGDDGIVQMIEP